MTIGSDDMDAFYDADVFGSQCARRRLGEDDLPFVGILGSVDELALEGHAVSAAYGLRYPTAAVDLNAGDRVVVDCDRDEAGTVILLFGEVQGGTEYKVRREPWRINDGAETAALLSSIPS